jgi:hypothetical protein
MRAVIDVVAACLVCAALAACGGSGGSAGSDRQQIASMFSSVDKAMANGDYAGACGHFSSHQRATIVAGANRAGLKVTSCAGALTTLIKQTGITRAQLAQTFGGGGAPKVQSVSVRGDQATVTYITSTQGKKYVETDGLVREGGQWKADRIIKRNG